MRTPGPLEPGPPQVLQALQASNDPFYALNEQLKPQVLALIAANPSAAPGPDTMTLGQGTWRVFHAPHLERLSSAVGARVEPIRYTLDGDRLFSNVRYSHPLLGAGWLSASGGFLGRLCRKCLLVMRCRDRKEPAAS